ncbi:uncharacterized protein LOC118429612 isoform X3 [Branchiostoma floridae]|uniref:Uncharacterized protein LOC118429612 isoform X3 n=1 Tax=Branchiostoma floridae TaxID=7739 RepID=A0A9J7NB62_BRAFL|nr:uncharacterized protein LOC118429612 isoform X3 [Branchiostoma floridae]
MVLQTIYVITVTVTALTLGIICLLVAPRLLRRFVPKYAELPIGTRLEFDTRVMSVCHSTVVGLLSICTALVDDSIQPHVIRHPATLRLLEVQGKFVVFISSHRDHLGSSDFSGLQQSTVLCKLPAHYGGGESFYALEVDDGET